MDSTDETAVTYSAFAGDRLVASGPLTAMLTSATAWLRRAKDDKPLLVFEDATGRQVDFDLRGTPEEVVARAVPDPARVGPGRPKLGVVSREISLLPRHWEWLEAQPSGASAALRRLVDEARKRDPGALAARRLRDATSRFMTAMAGDRPHFEEASRALFADDHDRFRALVRRWPKDVRTYLERNADSLARLLAGPGA